MDKKSLYRIGWKGNRIIAEKLFNALEKREIYAIPVGDIKQAVQLSRLSVLAIMQGRRTISDKDASKWAHVAYYKEERKAVFEWVRDFLVDNFGLI